MKLDKKATDRVFHGELLATGERALSVLRPLVRRADPERRVSPRSEVLCAGLALLARECARALGARPTSTGLRPADEVELAAAALSLLTKVDDQVIDALDFHGGSKTDRELLRRKTRAFLAPTLRSLIEAKPSSEEPRCELAAELGKRLRAFGSPRLERLLALIERGWEIQVEGVAIYSSSPAATTREAIARVTGEISGAWLLMITMVGMLPRDARRALTADEEAAFFDWGWAIQRADALADLGKDFEDGFVSSWPGRLAWEADPLGFSSVNGPSSEACTKTGKLYELVARTEADLACLPREEELAALEGRLAGLGEVPRILRWIHGFLTWRYVVHPCSVRAPDDPRFAPFIPAASSWEAFRAGSDPCSER